MNIVNCAKMMYYLENSQKTMKKLQTLLKKVDAETALAILVAYTLMKAIQQKCELI